MLREESPLFPLVVIVLCFMLLMPPIFKDARRRAGGSHAARTCVRHSGDTVPVSPTLLTHIRPQRTVIQHLFNDLPFIIEMKPELFSSTGSPPNSSKQTTNISALVVLHSYHCYVTQMIPARDPRQRGGVGG